MPYVSTNGIETYYDRRGEGDPVVFIHGSGWDHRQWMPQLTTLDQEYDVISYDVRGHGQTGGSEQTELTFDTFIEDLRSLIQALGIDNPTLVGLSMGGRIAHVCAATYPDLPELLVTYEAPVRLEPSSASSLRTGFIRTYSIIYRFLGPYRAYKLQNWLRQKSNDIDNTESDSVVVDGLGITKEEYVKTAIKQIDMEENLKLMKSLGDNVDSPSQITVPTLILTGDGPNSFNLEAADQLAEKIPKARRHTLSNAGHAGNIDNPTGFNQQLQSFISEKPC
jgi:pimeloyl-ACP methyl ester carboxylesterase